MHKLKAIWRILRADSYVCIAHRVKDKNIATVTTSRITFNLYEAIVNWLYDIKMQHEERCKTEETLKEKL